MTRIRGALFRLNQLEESDEEKIIVHDFGLCGFSGHGLWW
jgi:hypothetical protein